MRPSPKDQLADIVEFARVSIGYPLVMVGFLIHVVGVAVAAMGSFITDGTAAALEFWKEHIS